MIFFCSIIGIAFLINFPTFTKSLHEVEGNLTDDKSGLFSKKIVVLRFLTIINLIIGAWYLQWRFTNSLNFQALWLSVPLLIVEFYSYLGGILFLFLLWKVPEKINLIEDLPSVDLLVACHEASLDLIEKNTRQFLSMDWPNLHVYLIDDGNNLELSELVERLNEEDITYFQKEKEHNHEYILDEVNKYSCLKLSTHQDSLAELLSWFEQFKLPCISLEVWWQCQTILAEGFENAVNHAHKNLPVETPIIVEVKITDDSIELNIFDRGLGFDLDKLLAENLTEIAADAESGRGIWIVKQLANSVTYTRNNDGSNCLSLIKDYSCLPQIVDKVFEKTQSNCQFKRCHYRKISRKNSYRDIFFPQEKDFLKHQPSFFPLDEIEQIILAGKNSGDFLVYLNIFNSISPKKLAKSISFLKKERNDLSLPNAWVSDEPWQYSLIKIINYLGVLNLQEPIYIFAKEDLISKLDERVDGKIDRFSINQIKYLYEEIVNDNISPSLTEIKFYFQQLWQDLEGKQLVNLQIVYLYYLGLCSILFLFFPMVYYFWDIIPLSSYNRDFFLHFVPAVMVNWLVFFVAGKNLKLKNIIRDCLLVSILPIFWLEIIIKNRICHGRRYSSSLEEYSIKKQHMQNYFLPIFLLATIVGMILSGYKFWYEGRDNYIILAMYFTWGIWNLLAGFMVMLRWI